MEALLNFVETYLAPALSKIADEKHMKGIQKGIMATVPFTIIGSFFLIIACLPIPAWSNIIKNYQQQLLVPVSVTFDMLSIIAAIGIGYNMAKEYKQDPIQGALFTLIGFFMLQLTPEYALDTSRFGAKGLFAVIIVSILCVEIQKLFTEKEWVIKLPSSVPPAVASSFAGLLPFAAICVILWTIRVVLNFDVNGFITILFQPLVFALNSLPGILVFIILRSLLWCVGIHGAVLDPVASPIFLQFIAENSKAFATGQPIPYITASGFLDIFVFIGGGGATLGFVLLMLMSKEESFKTLGRLSLPSSIFEINEPVVFGAPVVLNPIFMIPYILGNVILTLLTYILMAFNIIGRPVVVIPWTTPPVIGHYLVTGGDWRAAVWGIISILLSMAIYYPFFKIEESNRLKFKADQLVKTDE
ncbi:PTS sugar transporter subunit IIC [Tepidanaerobacter syntrophicus]|uniref:PTS sugar transporter subunit IIC n=1 Tax=Tepidanaerobacter syntrophicus TaxID=224999 RepID=UPI001BD3999B|nr:PTS transporter subunit EIIC [Tepidanaerobacter syntrophicus]